jgi:hypothetical protein
VCLCYFFFFSRFFYVDIVFTALFVGIKKSAVESMDRVWGFIIFFYSVTVVFFSLSDNTCVIFNLLLRIVLYKTNLEAIF